MPSWSKARSKPSDWRTVSRWVRDGVEALTYLRQLLADSSPLPQVIFLDWNLPKISGLEVLKSIKATDGLKTIPVVF